MPNSDTPTDAARIDELGRQNTDLQVRNTELVERNRELVKALREICDPPTTGEGTIMISREIAIARAALEAKP